MVLQDTWLFGGTIAENIAYGADDPTRREVVEAAQATHVDRFVRTLPDGYDTVLDEEGGERQRRGEAADHHRPGVPGRASDPHPGRGDQLGRHPDRSADPAGDELLRLGPDVASSSRTGCPPSATPTDPGDGGRRDRRAGHPRVADRGRGAVRAAVPGPIRAADGGGGLTTMDATLRAAAEAAPGFMPAEGRAGAVSGRARWGRIGPAWSRSARTAGSPRFTWPPRPARRGRWW